MAAEPIAHVRAFEEPLPRAGPWRNPTSVSSSPVACVSVSRSAADSSASARASASTRRRRPASSTRAPRAVARTRVMRRSDASGSRDTSPSRSSAAMMRVMVGGRTCSAAASSVSVNGPPKTTTDSADSRGAGSPLAASSRLTRRRRWIATECSRSARSTVVGATRRGLSAPTPARQARRHAVSPDRSRDARAPARDRRTRCADGCTPP